MPYDKRRIRRENLVGEGGVAIQDRRRVQRKLAARRAGRSMDIAEAAEAVRRVSEYKKKRVSPEQRDYKPPNHGKRKK
jgi:hypothetical protein